MYPDNFYQINKTFFEQLEHFGICVPLELRWFSNLAVFDFESYTLPDTSLRNTENLTWDGRHVPICVSIASNLLERPIFLWNKDPNVLIHEFTTELDKLAEHSKIQVMSVLESYVWSFMSGHLCLAK